MYSTPLNDAAPAVAKRDWMKIGVTLGLVVVVLNFALTLTLVAQLAAAQAKVDKYDAVFTQAEALLKVAKPQVQYYMGEFDHFSKQARKLSDYANRFLHGSVPDLGNDLIQSEWSRLGFNASTFAGAVRKAFDQTKLGTYNEDINMWAAYVESVAKVISQINPSWTIPAPKPSDDEGFLNTFSYIIEWVDSQTDKTAWRNTASSCVDLIDAVLPVNWSGKYIWHNGQRYGYFDWNSWVNYNFPLVRDTCAYFANIKFANGTESDANAGRR
jgi:hypothetical protein